MGGCRRVPLWGRIICIVRWGDERMRMIVPKSYLYGVIRGRCHTDGGVKLTGLISAMNDGHIGVNLSTSGAKDVMK